MDKNNRQKQQNIDNIKIRINIKYFDNLISNVLTDILS
jgi:hypothetical protein